MLNRFVALSGGIWFSLKYFFRLNIARGESVRYFRKSANLAICYSGFSMPYALGQAFRAGKSAFLCCAYDVVTDWRSFGPRELEIFKAILSLEAPSVSQIALELYAKDVGFQLDEDGLERGSYALKFITRLIGTEILFGKSIDIEYAGRLWQLVDDLMDYGDDLEAGDLNCLLSSRRLLYLRRVELLSQDPFASTFLRDRVLAQVVRRAIERARQMGGPSEETPSFNSLEMTLDN